MAVAGAKPGGRGRGLVLLRWRLVPNWSAGGRPGPTNARSETVDRLATLRDSFRDRRCLIPADGFFEWQAVGKKMLPWRFTLADGGLMAVAGLWDVWAGGGRKLVTCCLPTTAANDTVRPLHDRMPCVRPPVSWDAWLAPAAELLPLLRPYPGPMHTTQANPLVDKTGTESPGLLAA